MGMNTKIITVKETITAKSLRFLLRSVYSLVVVFLTMTMLPGSVSAEEVPVCGIPEQVGRTIVAFDGKTIISNGDVSEKYTHSASVDIPAGEYSLTVASFDYPAVTPVSEGDNESWYISFRHNSEEIATSSGTTDIADDFQSQYVEEQLEGSVIFTESITDIAGVHTSFNTTYSNSVTPVCVAFDVFMDTDDTDTESIIDVEMTIDATTEFEEEVELAKEGEIDITVDVTEAVEVAVPVLINEDLLESPQSCSFLSSYIYPGAQNDTEEIFRLQAFLKVFEDADIELTGVYDNRSILAVNAFQLKYAPEVLGAWGLESPTGNVYITTQKKINEVYCGVSLVYSEAEYQKLQLSQQAISAEEIVLAEDSHPILEPPVIDIVPEEAPVDDMLLDVEVYEEPQVNTEDVSIKDNNIKDIIATNTVATTSTMGETDDISKGADGVSQVASIVVGFVDLHAVPILLILVVVLILQLYYLWRGPRDFMY